MEEVTCITRSHNRVTWLRSPQPSPLVTALAVRASGSPPYRTHVIVYACEHFGTPSPRSWSLDERDRELVRECKARPRSGAVCCTTCMYAVCQPLLSRVQLRAVALDFEPRWAFVLTSYVGVDGVGGAGL